jgi:hypothetical protein
MREIGKSIDGWGNLGGRSIYDWLSFLVLVGTNSIDSQADRISSQFDGVFQLLVGGQDHPIVLVILELDFERSRTQIVQSPESVFELSELEGWECESTKLAFVGDFDVTR